MELLILSSHVWGCRLLPSRRPGWRGAPPQIGVRFIIVPRPSAVGFVCRRAKHVCQSFHLPPSHSLRLFPRSGAGSCGLSISDRCYKWIAFFVLEPVHVLVSTLVWFPSHCFTVGSLMSLTCNQVMQDQHAQANSSYRFVVRQRMLASATIFVTARTYLFAANTVTLAVLIPTANASRSIRASVGAVQLAVNAVNSGSLLNGKTLEVVVKEVACDSSAAMAAITESMGRKRIAAVIGPDCSLACESTAYLTAGLKMIQISYACNSPLLSDKAKYPMVNLPRHACTLV